MPSLRCSFGLAPWPASSVFARRRRLAQGRSCVPPWAKPLRSFCTVPASQSSCSTNKRFEIDERFAHGRPSSTMRFIEQNENSIGNSRVFARPGSRRAQPLGVRLIRGRKLCPPRSRRAAVLCDGQPGLESVAADEITRDLGGEVKKTERGHCRLSRPGNYPQSPETAMCRRCLFAGLGHRRVDLRAADLDKIRKWTAKEPDWNELCSCITACDRSRRANRHGTSSRR